MKRESMLSNLISKVASNDADSNHLGSQATLQSQYMFLVDSCKSCKLGNKWERGSSDSVEIDVSINERYCNLGEISIKIPSKYNNDGTKFVPKQLFNVVRFMFDPSVQVDIRRNGRCPLKSAEL